jgi:hypothetical protein
MTMALYKYLAPDRVDVLENQRIRFTPPGTFNDPFELRPSVNIETNPAVWSGLFLESNRQEYDALPAETRNSLSFEKWRSTQFPHRSKDVERAVTEMRNLQGQIYAAYYERVNEKYVILSLSARKDNLLMWAHYASSHTGFVIEFDEHNEFFGGFADPGEHVGELKPVRYLKTRPTYTVPPPHSTYDTYYVKSTQWAHEQEWRLITVPERATLTVRKGQELLHLFAFPMNAITAVLFGCRMQPEHEGRIMLALQKARASHVAVYKAEIDTAVYRLNFTRR